MEGIGRKLNILITAIGGDIAQSAIRIVREVYPDFKIYGSDASFQPFFSSSVDEFVLSPIGSDNQFIDWVRTFCIENEIDLVIPMAESEISLLSVKQINKLPKILVANEKTVRIGLDKLETNKYLLSLGKFAPEFYEDFSNADISYPVIVKERFGSGSKSIKLCKNFNQVQFYYQQMQSPFIQELLFPADEEITCAVFRFINGEIRVIQMHRKLSGGRTLWAKVISDDIVEKMCFFIASELDLFGAMNIQLILTAEGPKIFEINPRYSSTVEMRHKIGFSDLVWGINEHFGFPQHKYTAPSTKITVGRSDRIIVIGM